jgi:hypothetical protein
MTVTPIFSPLSHIENILLHFLESLHFLPGQPKLGRWGGLFGSFGVVKEWIEIEDM